MLTGGEILAIIAGLVTVITAVSVGVVNVIVALRTSAAIKDNTAITSQTLTTAKVIEGHVNSEQTKAAEQLLALARENKLLRDQIADTKTTAALLAQSAAASRAPGQAGPSPAGSAEQSLESIDASAKAIDENTKKTDEKIDALKDATT